jgi:hypothetical protein
VWSIVGTPRDWYTVIAVAVDVAVSVGVAHEDVPASDTITVMS